MSKYNIAILVDNFTNNPLTQQILIECLNKPKYKVTIFTISKENIVPTTLPVLNIADYFAWTDTAIITSSRTLEKSIMYPSPGPCIIIGGVQYNNYYNMPSFNLDYIESIINEYNTTVSRPNTDHVNQRLSNESNRSNIN